MMRIPGDCVGVAFKSTGSTLLSQNLERLLKVYHLQIACSTDLQQVNHKTIFLPSVGDLGDQ